MFVKKYKKRPIEVEAVQITTMAADEIRNWVDSDMVTVHDINDKGRKTIMIEIVTSTGSHMATIGDWLIRGIDGNYYAVTNDTFQRLYETA